MDLPVKRLNVLLSAYACEPNRGSEPGVGWEWATRLSKIHNVTVITRRNNRRLIEDKLASSERFDDLRFIYLDLPNFFLLLKKIGILPIPIYYIIWQLAARIAIVGQTRNYDLIHHVTFNGFRFPGAWWFTGTSVVLGPLGGGSIVSSVYRRCFGKRWLSEWLRGLSVRFWKANPWTLGSLLSADAVIAVGEEMGKKFASIGVNSDLMLETAVPLDLESEQEIQAVDLKKNFMLVGNLEPWKAWQIALQAFAKAIRDGMIGQKLIVVGSGSQLQDAQTLAETLDISDHVEFTGFLIRNEVWSKVRCSRGLIFSSVRDTSGNVALEAMALRCPVICFQHQGVAWMTNDECAYRIKPDNWDASVAGFSKAIKELAINDELVSRMGTAGRQRSLAEFSWDAKIQQILKVYQRVIK